MSQQQLNLVNDGRVSLDEKTGVVRSFFGTELVQVSEERNIIDPGKEADFAFEDEARNFLKLNEKHFHLSNIALEVAELRKGVATTSIRYQQFHGGLPIYGAELLVSMRKRDGRIISAVNNVDYLISNQAPGGARLTEADVETAVADMFGNMVRSLTMKSGPLFIYRHRERDQVPPLRSSSNYKRVMKLASAEEGKVYLVRQVKVDTQTPSGNWELLVDTANGKVVAVFDRRSYLGPRAYVFEPDPITSSGQDYFNWMTDASILDTHRVDVELEDLDPPRADGNWFLSGTWVQCLDIEPARFPSPPSNNGNFHFGSKDYPFLFAMVYYWGTRLIKYLRAFGIETFNDNSVGPFKMDPLGLEIDGLVGELAKTDNSLFRVEADDTPCIVFGEGGVPDASDAHVIVHEYGHAIHHFLKSRQGCYEEGFCDFLAAAWLDRFNRHGLSREIVFPWDNNRDIKWGPRRRLDRPEKFSDQSFRSYERYLVGDIWATALWDLFLSIGGNGAPDDRIAAVDTIIRMYMEMLLQVDDHSDPVRLAQALMEADKAIHGYPGKYRQQIWDAFVRRELWTGNPPPLQN